MKKLLIIMIALLSCLAVTLTIAAGIILTNRNKAKDPLPTEPLFIETEAPVTTEPAPSPTETPATEATITQVEMTEAPVPTETQAPTAPPQETVDGIVFRPVNRTVYATQRVNVRKGPAVSHESIGKLNGGSAVEQIAVGGNWSKIWFQGQKAYVASEYLTSEKPKDAPAPSDVSFQQANETIYSTGSINLRSGPGKGYEAVGYLQPGDSAKRIGIGDNGWSKLNWQGKTVYAASQYLSTTKPEKDPIYKDTDETVYATEKLNLRVGAGTNYKIEAKLETGTSIRRIAVGDNGWSKVLYEGSVLYASSEYLTAKVPEGPSETKPAEKPAEKPTEPPMPDYKKVDETLVAAQELILHSGPGASYQELGHLTKGSLVHRTGIFENGWSRILLGGKDVYVVSAYLTEEKKPAEPKPTEKPEEPKPELPGYVKNEKTVYVTADDVNVRAQPNTSSEKLGKLSKGTSIKRLAVGDDGWSQVQFNDRKAFIKSSLLTDEPPMTSQSADSNISFAYKEVDETVYSTDSVFLRAGAGTEQKALGSLNYGESARRIGISDQGWSKLQWEQQIVYAKSEFLTTEKPEMPDFGETTTPGFPTPNSPFIYQYVDDPKLIPYAIFEPVSGSGDEALPLIISLHGSAEVGKNRDFMEDQHLTKVFREWEYTKLDAFEAYVVCPHIAADVPFKVWGTPQGADALFQLIDHLKKNYHIDESRIILEGHSMGGQGALYMAADERACFQKLVVVSGYEAGVDYDKIQIPVMGCSGGGPAKAWDCQDSPTIYKFMNGTFKKHFGPENMYEGPYNHDNVAIEFFKKDEDKNNSSDIIDWMLN